MEVCGKTGTAQVASEDYVKSHKGEIGARNLKDNAWFVGFAPRRAPEIVVAALFEHGAESKFAAPIVRDMIKAYFDKKTRLTLLQQQKDQLAGKVAALATMPFSGAGVLSRSPPRPARPVHNHNASTIYPSRPGLAPAHHCLCWFAAWGCFRFPAPPSTPISTAPGGSRFCTSRRLAADVHGDEYRLPQPHAICSRSIHYGCGRPGGHWRCWGTRCSVPSGWIQIPVWDCGCKCRSLSSW